MSRFDTSCLKVLLALLLTFSSFTAKSSEPVPPDFIVTSEATVNESRSLPNDFALELEGIATPEEIDKVTQPGVGRRFWTAVKTKSRDFYEVVRSYPKILEFIKRTAPPAIRKGLTKVKVREKFQDIIVGKVEHILNTGPETILQANAHGVGIRLTGLIALGIGDLLTQKFLEYKWAQKIAEFSENHPRLLPKITFLGVGLGAGVVFLKFHAHGKNYGILRFYANGEYPEKVMNIVIDAFAGIPLQAKVSERVDVDEVLRKRIWLGHASFSRSHLSMAGGITSEPKQSRYLHELYFLSTPSPIGNVSFYDMRVRQLQFNIVFSVDWFSKAYNSVKSLFRGCRKSVSGS